MAAPVVVHTLSGCIHCFRALSLLRRRGIEHEIVRGDGIPGFRAELQALTGGATVPQIVLDGRAIGGADQLARLDRTGVLEVLVEGGSLPVIRARRRRWPRRGPWLAEAFDADGERVGRAIGADERSARAQLSAPGDRSNRRS